MKVESGYLEENQYYGFVDKLFEDGYIYGMSYQKFAEWLGFEIGIDEAEFVKAIEMIKDTGIFKRDDFERENANVPDWEEIYDPHKEAQ